MAQSSITFLILGATVALFMWNKVPVAIVATGVCLGALGDSWSMRRDQAPARACRSCSGLPIPSKGLRAISSSARLMRLWR